MLKKKIAFIGPGVMAEAMIAGLLNKKLAKPENIIASGPRSERGTELQKSTESKPQPIMPLPYRMQMWLFSPSNRSDSPK